MNAPREPETQATPVDEQSLQIPARDGCLLGATFYRRAGQAEARDVVLFNGGGGLAIARYRHFLRFVAAEGYPVLAYDYRGVGISRPDHLRGFDAGIEDWAEYDQAGAIDSIRARHPDARVASMSHSIGCLVAGAAPNASAMTRMVYIAPHTGYWRDYAARWKWPMALFWHVAMPLLARGVGYFPGRAIGIGDDIPLRFALQWAGRTTAEFALASDDERRARTNALLDFAGRLEVPGMALHFGDDAFATDAGVRRFLSAIARAPVVRTDVDVHAGDVRRIGHFGFFSRRNAALWSTVTRFLESARG